MFKRFRPTPILSKTREKITIEVFFIGLLSRRLGGENEILLVMFLWGKLPKKEWDRPLLVKIMQTLR